MLRVILNQHDGVPRNLKSKAGLKLGLVIHFIHLKNFKNEKIKFFCLLMLSYLCDMKMKTKIVTFGMNKYLFTEEKNPMKFGPFFLSRADLTLFPFGSGYVIQRPEQWTATISLLPKIQFSKWRRSLADKFQYGISIHWWKWNIWIDFNWFKRNKNK